MNLLLDTHIWLWSLLDPERLRPTVAEAVRDPGNDLWLSPISVWEAVLLAERGRIRISAAPDAWVRQLLRGFPIREAPLTREVALASRRVELVHQDPADRFIAATAQVHDLVLVTDDERLTGSTDVATL